MTGEELQRLKPTIFRNFPPHLNIQIIPILVAYGEIFVKLAECPAALAVRCRRRAGGQHSQGTQTMAPPGTNTGGYEDQRAVQRGGERGPVTTPAMSPASAPSLLHFSAASGFVTYPRGIPVPFDHNRSTTSIDSNASQTAFARRFSCLMGKSM